MDVEMATDAAPPAPASAPATAASTGSPGTLKHGEPRRRNRPALSCIQCRTRKIRCDRNEPCASCMKSKIVNCTYEEARRPKPRLWRLSPAPPASNHHPELSPTSTDERAGIGSAFSFRDIAVPAPPPPATSNPSGASPNAAPLGKPPEPLSGVSPRSLPQTHHAEAGAGAGLGATGPLGHTTALAERVRQLEQQLADALKRPGCGSPSSRSAHTALSPEHGPQYRPTRSNSWMDGEKLVGFPSFPLPPPFDHESLIPFVVLFVCPPRPRSRTRSFFAAVHILPTKRMAEHAVSCRADCPAVSPRSQHRRTHRVRQEFGCLLPPPKVQGLGRDHPIDQDSNIHPATAWQNSAIQGYRSPTSGRLLQDL